jgi:hypothetical protein
MKTSDSSLDRIRKELGNRGVTNRYLLSELTDHIASDMELMMGQGLKEEEALEISLSRAGRSEIESTARQYGGILSSRYFRMKVLMWVAFALFAASWLFSSPLGLYAGMFSFLVMGATLVLLATDFFRSRRNHSANLGFALGSLLSGLLVISGYALLFLMIRLRINTRGHGVDLLIFSYLALSLSLFPYFLNQRKASLSADTRKEMTWFVLFCSMHLLFSVLSFLSLPFYAWAVDYIWILIWVILAFDLLCLVILLVRRIRNILFMVLLLLSFMITFIHSPLRILLPAGRPPVTQTQQP